MSFSRIISTFSLICIGLFSNLMASSSCSSLDDDSKDNFSLKSYLETTLSILEVLEAKLPEDQLVSLGNFKGSLEKQLNSVNFLAQFRDDERIYKIGDRRHGCIYYAVNEMFTSWDPKPNVHMEFVYQGNPSQTIGMVLSFYALNNSGKREGHSIVKGHVPFMCAPLGNSFDNKGMMILKAHAEGLPSHTRVVHSPFFDLKASEEVQEFLRHVSVIEPYFKRVNLRQENDPLNPYESNMTNLLDLMQIPYEFISEDVESSEEDDSGACSNSEESSSGEPHERSLAIGATPSPRTHSWLDWKENHKQILRDAKGDESVLAPECLKPLRQLLEFNPLNLKV